MKKIIKILLIFTLILIVSLAIFEIVQSASLTAPTGSGSGTPLTDKAGTSGVRSVIGAIIKTIIGVMGAFTLLMFVFGGITMLSSGGQQDRIQQGKKTLIWGAMGLILIVFSYVLVDFVISALTPGDISVAPPTPPPTATPVCSDGLDNDGDTKKDLDDPGCAGNPDGTSEEDPATPPTGNPCTIAFCTQRLHKPAKLAECHTAADCQTMIRNQGGNCISSVSNTHPDYCKPESGGNCACIPVTP
ncbi:hypothetical protein ACFL2U_00340 [Patescibacteria group bacterium]